MAGFAELGLAAPLLRAVEEKSYAAPTAIQTAVIPAVLAGRDVWACAHTGSGKTAAFALPLLQMRAQDARQSPRPIRTLILVPTRELAAQVGESIESYARHLPESIKVVTAFGGVSINPQMMALRGGADIVVATPGRLLDLIDHNALRLDRVTNLVLDEADRLFDLGFSAELTRILDMLPATRQNLLFSATFPTEVHALAERLLRTPVRVDIPSTAETAPDIHQRAIRVDTARRTQLLRHLIREHNWSRVLVFVATKYTTEHVADKLRRAGIQAAAFHGELSQGARTQTLADFKARHLQVVVATDVAARGIDIALLPAVVNYDLPRSTSDYIHRIGRTGRAGEAGVAVSFVSAGTEAHLRLIAKRHGLAFEPEVIAGFEPVETIEPAATPAAPGAGGIKGKRKSKKDKLRELNARLASPQDGNKGS